VPSRRRLVATLPSVNALRAGVTDSSKRMDVLKENELAQSDHSSLHGAIEADAPQRSSTSSPLSSKDDEAAVSRIIHPTEAPSSLRFHRDDDPITRLVLSSESAGEVSKPRVTPTVTATSLGNVRDVVTRGGRRPEAEIPFKRWEPTEVNAEKMQADDTDTGVADTSVVSTSLVSEQGSILGSFGDKSFPSTNLLSTPMDSAFNSATDDTSSPWGRVRSIVLHQTSEPEAARVTSTADGASLSTISVRRRKITAVMPNRGAVKVMQGEREIADKSKRDEEDIPFQRSSFPSSAPSPVNLPMGLDSPPAHVRDGLWPLRETRRSPTLPLDSPVTLAPPQGRRPRCGFLPDDSGASVSGSADESSSVPDPSSSAGSTPAQVPRRIAAEPAPTRTVDTNDPTSQTIRITGPVHGRRAQPDMRRTVSVQEMDVRELARTSSLPRGESDSAEVIGDLMLVQHARATRIPDTAMVPTSLSPLSASTSSSSSPLAHFRSVTSAVMPSHHLSTAPVPATVLPRQAVLTNDMVRSVAMLWSRSSDHAHRSTDTQLAAAGRLEGDSNPLSNAAVGAYSATGTAGGRMQRNLLPPQQQPNPPHADITSAESDSDLAPVHRFAARRLTSRLPMSQSTMVSPPAASASLSIAPSPWAASSSFTSSNLNQPDSHSILGSVSMAAPSSDGPPMVFRRTSTGINVGRRARVTNSDQDFTSDGER
jgi:hypothetical protein